MKSTWKLLNSVITNHADTTTDQLFEINGKLNNDPSLIADNLNSFFVNIGPSLAMKIPSTSVQTYEYLKDSIGNSLFLSPTDAAEIYSIITSLKSYSSPGIDNIPTHLIKSLADHLSTPLVLAINQAMTCGLGWSESICNFF